MGYPGPRPNVAYFINTPDGNGVRDYTEVLAMSDTERASAGLDDAFEDGVDIGPVGIAGNAWVAEDGSWHIQGSGNDLWDHDDQFHYMSKMTEGDIDVSVHVTAFSVSCVVNILYICFDFISFSIYNPMSRVDDSLTLLCFFCTSLPQSILHSTIIIGQRRVSYFVQTNLTMPHP